MAKTVIDTCYEDLPFEQRDFPFDVYFARGVRRTPAFLHRHDFLEINLITGGSGTNFINGSVFKLRPNDLFLINNNDHHIAISDGNLVMRIITFSPDLLGETSSFRHEYLSPFFYGGSFSRRFSLSGAVLQRVNAIVTILADEWRQRQEGYRLVIRANLMVLLSLFVREYGNMGSNFLVNDALFKRLSPAVVLMKESFNRFIGLDELADSCFLSRNYFCSVFKRLMGVSPLRYLEMIRISHACFLLKTSFKAVIDICFECGYGSLSGFNHAFKRVCGVSPLEYRKNVQEVSKF